MIDSIPAGEVFLVGRFAWMGNTIPKRRREGEDKLMQP